MKTNQYLMLLCLTAWSTLSYSHSIVFVHLGTAPIPDYALTALEQARLFNPTCPFYFIAQHNNLRDFAKITKKYNVTCIAAETLTPTGHHTHFIKTSRLDNNWHHGFWRYTTERFFYLEELMRTHNLRDVFHIENDVMLYVDVGILLPTFQKHYQGIGITFPSDNQCVPGFVYIPSAAALQPIAQFLAYHAHEGQDDGLTLSKCKNTLGTTYIDHLPIVCAEYKQYYPMKNLVGETALHPEYFSKHIEEFNSIFDAAAFGQFLGGWSPLNQSWNTGKFCKNFWSMFDAEHITVMWEADVLGRKVPYALFPPTNTKYPINNLHIHCKELKGFCS